MQHFSHRPSIYALVSTTFPFTFCIKLFTSSLQLRPLLHTFRHQILYNHVHIVLLSTHNTPKLSPSNSVQHCSHHPSMYHQVSTTFAFKFCRTPFSSSFHLRQSLHNCRIQIMYKNIHKIFPSTPKSAQLSPSNYVHPCSHFPSIYAQVSKMFALKFCTTLFTFPFNLRPILHNFRLQKLFNTVHIILPFTPQSPQTSTSNSVQIFLIVLPSTPKYPQ